MAEQQGRLRVAFETMGCRSNYADTVDLQAAVSAAGALPVSLDDAVDVVVLNSCTVTDSADREAQRIIRKVHRLAPQARIIVTGCMAEVRGEELADLDEVATVIGPGRRDELLHAVLGGAASTPRTGSEGPRVSCSETQEDELVQLPLRSRRGRKSLPDRWSISLNDPISPAIAGPGAKIGEVPTRARFHLRVQEGCENACTFCIIPHTRGRLSSRELKAVLDDVRHLAAVGYEEIVLTGTHLGGWGEDRSGRLHDLLAALEEADLGPRYRLSSIDPNDLEQRTVRLIGESDTFCKHLHICVQAFSDHTLKRMNRRYRMQDVRELLWYTTETIPGVCIGSDLIAGFPGESRQEVDQGIEEFLRLPISYLHVFPYSERSGTAATRLDGPVDLKERKRRAARWRAIAQRKRDEFYRSLIGRSVEFVVERIEEDAVTGTTGEFAPARLPSVAAATAKPLRLGNRVRATVVAYETGANESGELVCR